MTEPHLKKGEIITCENGHEVCEIIQDVYLGQMNWHLCLGKWRQSEPKPGARLPDCEICRGTVFSDWGMYVSGVLRKFEFR